MTAPIDRADAEEKRMVVHPVKYSKTPARAALSPPSLGSHTDEILREFVAPDEFAALKERGVIG